MNVAAGHSYNLELYFLDYDAKGRAETVTLSDANTNATLNSQSVSNFANGEYLIWTISGNVLITFTRTAGVNAVLSGLFFDPAGPPLASAPADRDCELCRFGHDDAGQLDRCLRQSGITTSWAAV